MEYEAGINKGNLFIVLGIVLLASMMSFALVANENAPPPVIQNGELVVSSAETGNIIIKISGHKHFMALNKIQHWNVELTTLRNTPIAAAKLLVDGGMPAHAHGLPTEPVVEHVNDNVYKIKGLKFSMAGVWVLFIDINTEDIAYKLTLEFDLRYGKQVKILTAKIS